MLVGEIFYLFLAFAYKAMESQIAQKYLCRTLGRT